MAARVAILFLMIYALLVGTPPANSKPHGIRASLIRREKAINFTRAALQSRERQHMLARRLYGTQDMGTQTPLRKDRLVGEYDMKFSVGTPLQTFWGLADTGSDLVWVNCFPTTQGPPSFDPSKSSTFSKLPCSSPLCNALESQGSCGGGGTVCDYKYNYGFGSMTSYAQGYMGTDTFTVGGDAVPSVAFGCTTNAKGSIGANSGLVGLDSGPLSLVTQMGFGALSYCLVNDPNKESPLLFGSLATLKGTGIQSTPLVKKTTLYAVNVTSISIGSVLARGSGNTFPLVFDSGSTLTYITDPAYTEAKNAILSLTSLKPVRDPTRSGFDVCFQVANNVDISKSVPSMVLNFLGADMDLPLQNYFKEVRRGVICWVVVKSSLVSIIGNIMQMNYNIRYDIDNKVLSYQPANCDTI